MKKTKQKKCNYYEIKAAFEMTPAAERAIIDKAWELYKSGEVDLDVEEYATAEDEAEGKRRPVRKSSVDVLTALDGLYSRHWKIEILGAELKAVRAIQIPKPGDRYLLE